MTARRPKSSDLNCEEGISSSNAIMNALSKPTKLPYIARAPRAYGWFFTLMWLAIWIMILYDYPRYFEELGKWNWMLILASFFVFIWAPLFLLGGFFYRLVFDVSFIERVSIWKGNRRWSYSDVIKVDYSSDGGHIRISFIDGTSIKVWKSEANLQYIGTLLNEKCDEPRK